MKKKGDTLAHVKVDLSTQTDQLVLTAKTDLVALLPCRCRDRFAGSDTQSSRKPLTRPSRPVMWSAA